MNEADQSRAHPAETAMDRAWTALRDARDAVALAALALLGDALPARFPGARYLHVANDRTAPRAVRVAGRDGAALKTFTTAEFSEGCFTALLGHAVAALDASGSSVPLTRRETSNPGAELCVDLAECARVLRAVPMARSYTVVGAWNRPEEIPGCQEREPVDAFVEHVEAPGSADAVRIALERQTHAHPQEAAPADAGYGMEPYAIAVFPLRLWPAAI